MHKKYLALLATPIAGLLIAVAAPVAIDIANAHIPQVTVSCTGLVVNLSGYEGNSQNNLVTIGIDNQPPGGVFFASSYSHTFTWSQTAVHSYSVLIDANRNSGNPTQYDAVFTGTWQPCQVASTTTSTPATTSTAPTTTVPTSTTVVGESTTLPAPITTVVVAVGQPPVPCAYDNTINADSPLCLPIVPVVIGNQIATVDRILPVTGSKAHDSLFIAIVLTIGGIGFLLLARRRGLRREIGYLLTDLNTEKRP